MQEVFEKIKEKCQKCSGIGRSSFVEVLKIIDEVSEQYNNGWISVSEVMPPEHDSVFAKLKGTNKWRDTMFEKSSDTVSVTVVGKCEEECVTTTAHTIDGKWSCDLLRINSSYRITHWQPLPEPYVEGGGE